MEKFNKRLAHVMDKLLKVSGNTVSRDLELNATSIGRYKNGLTPPSCEFLVKFCNFYKVSANWLLLEIEPIMLKDLVYAADDASLPELYKKKSIAYELDKLLDLANELKVKYGNKD